VPLLHQRDVRIVHSGRGVVPAAFADVLADKRAVARVTRSPTPPSTPSDATKQDGRGSASRERDLPTAQPERGNSVRDGGDVRNDDAEEVPYGGQAGGLQSHRRYGVSGAGERAGSRGAGDNGGRVA